MGSAQQEPCQGLARSPQQRWLSHLNPDLVFDQPILVVPDRAALLAQAGDHHPPCLHVLHIIGDREEELQLPAPDAEIDPSLQRQKPGVCTQKSAACTSRTSPAWGFGEGRSWGSSPLSCPQEMPTSPPGDGSDRDLSLAAGTGTAQHAGMPWILRDTCPRGAFRHKGGHSQGGGQESGVTVPSWWHLANVRAI